MARQYQKVVSETLRSLRGVMSQKEVSEHLNYTFNQCYRWESNKSQIDWVDFVRLAKVCNAPVTNAIFSVINFAGDSEDYGSIIKKLTGSRTKKEIGDMLGKSSDTVSRWMRGTAVPPAECLFHLFDISDLLLPFIRVIVDVEEIESLGSHRGKFIEDEYVAKSAGYMPFLYLLELDQYRQLPTHSDEFVAQHLGWSLDKTREAITYMRDVGLISYTGQHWANSENSAAIVSTIFPEIRQRMELKRHLLEKHLCAISEVQQANKKIPEYSTGHLLFTANADSRKKIEDLYHKFYADVLAIVKAQGPNKEPADRILALSINLTDLLALNK